MEKLPLITFCLIISAFFGLLLEILYFLHIFGNNIWIIIYVVPSLVVIPTIYSIFYLSGKKYKFVLIVMSACIMYIIYPLYAKDFSYVPPLDAAYHAQVADNIINENISPLGEGKGLSFTYSYYPSMHILVAILSSYTGQDPYLIIKLLPIIYIMIPFSFYIFTRVIFHSEKIAQISATISIFPPFIKPSPTYFFFGAIFIIFCLYCFFSLYIHKDRKYIILLIIFFFSMSITHHQALYYFIGLLLFFGIAIYFEKRLTKTSIESIPILLIVFLLTLGTMWPIFQAFPITLRQEAVIERSLNFSSAKIRLSLPAVYSNFEISLVGFSYLLILMLSFIGFFLFLKQKNRNMYFINLALWAGLMIVTLYATGSLLLANRTWLYLFMVGAPLAAFLGISKFTINSSFKLVNYRFWGRIKEIIVLSSIFMLSLSAMMTLPRVYYDFDWENKAGLLTVGRGYGEAAFSSVKWSIQYMSEKELALADEFITNLAGHFKLSAEKIKMKVLGRLPYKKIISFYELYSDPEKNQHYLGQYVAKYLFVDTLVSEYAEGKFEGFAYATWKQVPDSDLLFLTSMTPQINLIYNNGIVEVVFSER